MNAAPNSQEPGNAVRERQVSPDWKDAIAPFARADRGRAILDLTTSFVPYLIGWALMYLALDISYFLVLALAIPTAGFLQRIFIVFHDCTHGSFAPGKRANAWIGRVAGLFVFSPFGAWRHSHAMHHASAGDLDRRGDGDVPTLTVAEYAARSRKGRLAYRLFRNPAIMFTIGPIWSLVIGPRIWSRDQRPRIRHSVQLTNLALASTIAAVCFLIGWQNFVLIQGPLLLIAGAAGVWLFYVQHQYEDVYWERTDSWNYANAALQGSSYLRLPQPLQFFTGNIGLHHVHHLSAKVPNYNLQRAHDSCELFHTVPQLTIRDGLQATRLKLWDEDAGRLVTFAEARRSTAPSVLQAGQLA